MAGLMLGAEAAAGAKMNKGKNVKIAAVSVLAMAMLLLAAAAVPVARYDALQLIAFVASDSFLTICVASHVTTICLLALLGATAPTPTPASRRSYGRAIAASLVPFALNLCMVLAVRRFGAEVLDAA